MAVESESASELVFCPNCGRLMADEPGPLCDKCATPPAIAPESQPEPLVTWSLVAVTAVTSLLGMILTREQFPAGAMFGPNFASGQWWRAISAVFCHNTFGHFAWNMLPLAVLGSRLERILGHWTFLAFYLVCGAAGSVASVFLSPETPGVGASGAVFGVCAGLFVHYVLRLHELSRIQRTRLTALGIYTGYGIWSGLFTPHVDSVDHLAGLAAGLVLGWALSRPFARAARIRQWVFAASCVALILVGWSFRQSHLYLVHLDAASRAIKSGQTDEAEHEIHTALAMKPDSPVGAFLLHKLEQERQAPVDGIKNPFEK